MTSSTVTLRIQELAEANELTFEELSKLSGVSVQDIQAYATAPVKITEEAATKLRNIASQLNVPVVELVKPIAKREAFRFKILEMAQQKGLTLEELSKRSGVNPALIAFYSTQPICKQKIAETQCMTSLYKISDTLGCRVEDLQLAADIPVTQLRFEAFTDEKNLNLEDISLLTGYSQEFIDLIATQPLDIFNNFQDTESGTEIRDALCQVLGVGCKTK